MEETAEFQVGIDDAARRRRLRMGTRNQTIVAGEVEDVPVHDAVLCYCQCMQITLQASCSCQPQSALLNRLQNHFYDDLVLPVVIPIVMCRLKAHGHPSTAVCKPVRRARVGRLNAEQHCY